MSDSTKYSVITSGRAQIGFEPDEVVESFAVLFKMPSDKADLFLKKKRVIKKEIDHKTALHYKKKLENIGLVVTLKAHMPAPNAGLSLSLVPTDDEIAGSESEGVKDDMLTQVCPKCDTKIAANAEQCDVCKIYLHKVVAKKDPVPTKSEVAPPISDEPVNSFTSENLTGVGLILGSIAALLGAFIWSLVADITDRELGIIAWVIGGLVGYAVVFAGNHGEKAGIYCGILAIVAIFGGKYLIYDGIKDDLTNMLDVSQEEIRIAYNEEMRAVANFGDVVDEQSLRQFMANHDYSDSYDPEDITEDEIQYFKENEQEYFEQFSYNEPSFDKWYQVRVKDALGEISTFEVIKESIGIMDLVFLIFGVGTAYKIGRGEVS